jgi:hypothetical protein
MGSFLDSLKSNIERVQTEVNDKITDVAYKLFYRVVNNSPHVGDGPYVAGHFVANWFPAVNSYDTSITTVTSNGSDSLARIDSIVKTSKAFYGKDGFVSMSNNLNYAANVEWKAWPAGKDPVSGWTWTGMRRYYAPVSTSLLGMKADLQ